MSETNNLLPDDIAERVGDIANKALDAINDLPVEYQGDAELVLAAAIARATVEDAGFPRIALKLILDAGVDGFMAALKRVSV